MCLCMHVGPWQNAEGDMRVRRLGSEGGTCCRVPLWLKALAPAPLPCLLLSSSPHVGGAMAPPRRGGCAGGCWVHPQSQMSGIGDAQASGLAAAPRGSRSQAASRCRSCCRRRALGPLLQRAHPGRRLPPPRRPPGRSRAAPARHRRLFRPLPRRLHGRGRHPRPRPQVFQAKAVVCPCMLTASGPGPPGQ